MSLNDRTTPAATLGPHPATIRTFHPRRGRLSSRHLDALDRLWPWYGLDVPDAPSASIDPASEPADDNEPAAPTGEPTNPIELVELFGRDAPVVLEIGSGMGEATAAMAAADPGRNYLAVEVHTPGIANLLAMIERRELTNLRIADGDALVLLRHLIQPAALAAVNVFFPDPWPKARHHKRRLIQPAHVPVLRDRLAPGGRLHCVTDLADYAYAMRETLTADPELVNAYPGFAPRPPERPVTKFERRAIAERRPVFDLVFEKKGNWRAGRDQGRIGRS